jgi:hypothetical protein
MLAFPGLDKTGFLEVPKSCLGQHPSHRSLLERIYGARASKPAYPRQDKTDPTKSATSLADIIDPKQPVPEPGVHKNE